MPTRESGSLPSVAELLDVDREYRARRAAGDLTLIAPERFNPRHARWLPVLHTTRGDRRYTSMFSNTDLAHHVGRTHDWVVIYFDGPGGRGQCTVVTAVRGPLARRRIVRGRENECVSHYRLTARECWRNRPDARPRAIVARDDWRPQHTRRAARRSRNDDEAQTSLL